MSMLSVQCDKLRKRAAELRQGRWSDGADDARLMDDAADTIWQLRDDLQRANAENAKLRELVHTIWLAGDFRAFLGADEIKERIREMGVEVEVDD